VAIPAEAGGLEQYVIDRIRRMERRHFWFSGRRALAGRQLSRFLGEGPARALDLGCGTGSTAEWLEERGLQGFALDVDLHGIPSPRRARYARGSATALPFVDEAFDAVVAMDVLEHVDDEAALAEVRRVLKPGGLLFASVPAMPWLWGVRDLEAGHLRRYTRKGLLGLLGASGFEVTFMQYYQFLLFPMAFFSRFFGRARASWRDREERPGALANSALSVASRFEASLQESFTWPWGTSLSLVGRKR